MNIFAEVTIDETGIIEQMDRVRKACGALEDEAIKLYGMLARGEATAIVKKESTEEK